MDLQQIIASLGVGSCGTITFFVLYRIYKWCITHKSSCVSSSTGIVISTGSLTPQRISVVEPVILTEVESKMVSAFRMSRVDDIV